MRIYLDNCCFNRPFDDQTPISIRLEAEAKLYLQEQVVLGRVELAWSYMLDYENEQNPFRERRTAIAPWKGHCCVDISVGERVLELGREFLGLGIKTKDALHLACARVADCDVFVTTDKGILVKLREHGGMRVLNPLQLIEEITI